MYRPTLNRLLTGATVMLCAGTALAVPARPGITDVTTPDGETIAVRLIGDEFFHIRLTEDGYPLVAGDDGYYYYAEITSDFALRPSGIRAVSAEARDAETREWLSRVDVHALDDVLRNGRSAGLTRRLSSRQAPGATPESRSTTTSDRGYAQGPGLVPGSHYPLTGDQKGLVILVEYADVKFQTEDPADYFGRMLNERDFDDFGATGSARDFFEECSSGLFRPEFDVLGPVTLSQNMSYYGGNDARGNDLRPHRMCIEACEQLDDTVDFSQYDRDGDGLIDNVFIFYAGRGEASGGSSDTVWPHAWYVTAASSGTYEFDGVILDRYACSNEWEYSRETGQFRPDGVGTFIHEFSHVMGLPDLYATTYTSSFTPDTWSVMDYGPYNNDGMTPPLYGAYERYALGWMSPTPIKGAVNATLPPIGCNKAGIIHTEDFNEFFLLENRQQQGWDTYLPGHGMLVWHIHYVSNVWYDNAVNNNPQHQYVDIEEADGIQDEATRDGDAFPGASGITSFTPATTPPMTTWNGTPIELPVTDITETETGDITFRVCGGSEPIGATEEYGYDDVTPAGFTPRWNQVPDLDYLLSVYTLDGSGASEPAYVPGYRELNVGACGSFEVTGLEPETEYHYALAATNGWETGPLTAPRSVTTAPGSLPYDKVDAQEPSEVGDVFFTASWNRLDRASDYLINVYRKEPGEPLEEICDFSEGVWPLPYGWDSNSKTAYAEEGFFGQSAPALRLNKGSEGVNTPVYSDRVKYVSFWQRGTNNSDLIMVVAKTPTSYHTVRMLPVTAADGGAVEELFELPEGTTSIRLEYVAVTSGNSLAIDDIKVGHGHSLDKVSQAGYENLATGDVDCLKVTGLEPDTEYFYTVRGIDGDRMSLPSDEVRVKTGLPGGIGAAAEEPASLIHVEGRRIICADSRMISVYDAAGRRIGSGRGSVTLDSPGLYVVTVAGSGLHRKIAVR